VNGPQTATPSHLPTVRTHSLDRLMSGNPVWPCPPVTYKFLNRRPFQTLFFFPSLDLRGINNNDHPAIPNINELLHCWPAPPEACLLYVCAGNSAAASPKPPFGPPILLKTFPLDFLSARSDTNDPPRKQFLPHCTLRYLSLSLPHTKQDLSGWTSPPACVFTGPLPFRPLSPLASLL